MKLKIINIPMAMNLELSMRWMKKKCTSFLRQNKYQISWASTDIDILCFVCTTTWKERSGKKWERERERERERELYITHFILKESFVSGFNIDSYWNQTDIKPNLYQPLIPDSETKQKIKKCKQKWQMESWGNS
jgi:hypothetical protein